MRYLLSFTLFMLPMLLFAQPANDDCANAVPIMIDDCGVYNNVNANADAGFVNFNPIGLSCTPTTNEVWFSFIAPASPSDLQLTVTGIADGAISPLNQPSVSFLLGDCNAMLMEATGCQDAPAGSNAVQFNINGTALIPNFPYYIVVSGWSATATPNEGAFELCLETYTPPADICTGSPNTVTDCSGTIYDSGGDSGNYGPNENCVFTITPTIFSQCIVATVNFYDVENFSDFINFYDGPSTASPQIQSVTGVGANLEVQASSGSLTIEFTSDGSIENTGFEISWVCTPDECTVLSPIDVDPNVTVDQLVDALSSPQVLVENPILNCPDGAYGTYTSPGNTQLAVMDLPNGVVLSSGLAEEVENPEAFFASTVMGAPGDADLDALSTGLTTNDACVLEFDVYAATDELLFEYVFGSEEYPNFVNSSFNDIFAFFISGPDPTGGTYTNLNIAVLGDGVTPVEINTVNDVNPGAQFDPATGDVIYNNNAGGLSLPYGGYTSVLTARADVVPCNYYHLKLAIADRGDSSYDSGVFIADLQAGLPELSLEFEINSANGDNILVEGCSDNDFINAVLTNPEATDSITYYLQVEGIADENTDLTSPIPDSLIAPPGETIIQIPVIPVNDGIAEGVESFGLQVFGIFECDTVVYDSVSILIYDEIEIETDQDTFFVCSGTSVQLGVSGATDYTWGWFNPSELDNPNLSNPTLTPSQSGYIYVSGIINGNSNCVDQDSAFIQIIDPAITVVSPAPFICESESAQLEVSTNTNNTGISWTPDNTLSCSDCPNPVATPSETTVYTATVTAGGCSESADITVTVDPLAVPDVIDNAQICEGSSILLAGAPTGSGTFVTSYEWIPNDGTLDDPNSPTPTATPPVTTTYTVISTSDNGVCIDSTSVTIDVAPATIDILGPDTVYQCNDALSAVTFNTTSIAAPGDIMWSDSDGNMYPNGSSLTVNPTEVTTYYATINFGACTNSDSVVIQIDSLPDFMLDVSVPSQGIAVTNPDTVDVCSDPSESFFVSNLYNSALYPELQHEWFANGTSYTPPQDGANLLDNLPLVTTNYVLESNNNACSALDSFVIDVNTPPNFSITPSAATICAGQSVQLEAMGATNFTWVPDDGTLSDINISNPVASPTQTTTYTAFADIAGCQAGVSTTITVLDVPSIVLIPDATICAGETIALGTGADDPNFTYTWSPNDFVSGDGTANPTAAPAVTTTYSVTVSNGVCDITESVTITVSNDLPLVISGDGDLCLGESTTLSANTQGAVNWFENGVLIGNGPSITITPSAVGSQTITAEAFSNFCNTTQDFIITTSATPNVTATGDATICDGETADISATTDAGTLMWAPANEFADPTLAMQTVSPSGTTTYTVTADNNGCEASADVTITVDDAPVYGVLDDSSICTGESIAIGVLNDSGTTYSWTANPADPSLVDGTSGTPIVSPTQTTTYTLTATNGLCTETDEVTITVVDPIVTPGTAPTICAGETATLTATGTPAGGNYVWTDWEGNPVGTGSTVDVNPFGTSSYNVSYEIDGCFTAAVADVNVIPVPVTGISATSNQIVVGEDATITVTGAPAGSTFTWVADNDNNPSGDDVVTVTPTMSTTYIVTITSPEGCQYTETIFIEVLSIDFEVPNAFTPNNDGTNDSFFPIYSEIAHDILEFKIFDRWGELVHDSVNTPWDGTYNGKPLPNEIYVYFVRVRFNDGTEEFRKGDVALMR